MNGKSVHLIVCSEVDCEQGSQQVCCRCIQAPSGARVLHRSMNGKSVHLESDRMWVANGEICRWVTDVCTKNQQESCISFYAIPFYEDVFLNFLNRQCIYFLLCRYILLRCISLLPRPPVYLLYTIPF